MQATTQHTTLSKHKCKQQLNKTQKRVKQMAWNNQTPNRLPTRQWQKLRQATLHRDNHTCQLQHPGCTTTATQVDHITNLNNGGTNHPNNLQAVCTNCHKQKTQHESLQARTRHKRKPKPHPLDTPTTNKT